MSSIQDLIKISKDLNILYVEDSENLLKQMSSFLEKIFKNVYKAKDGQEGLHKYKELQPHIVITDLTMPNMDGFDMIRILKQINPDVKIIIISAHVDTDNLLEAIHLGVSDFVPKPVDRTLLSNTLFKVCSQIVPKNDNLDHENLKKQEDLLVQLEMLSEQKVSLDFINHYKGVPIDKDGTLVSCENSRIVVHAPFIQTLAIAYEKYTSFESKYLDYTVEADLLGIDLTTREIKLHNLRKSKYSAKKREQVRLEPDRDFKTVFHFKNKKYDVDTIDVSIRSISINMQKDINLEIDEKDDALVNMGFSVHHKGGELVFEDKVRISTKAKVFKVIENKKNVEIILLYELNKKDEDIMAKYIMEREIALIKEFKKLNLEEVLKK